MKKFKEFKEIQEARVVSSYVLRSQAVLALGNLERLLHEIAVPDPDSIKYEEIIGGGGRAKFEKDDAALAKKLSKFISDINKIGTYVNKLG